MSSLESDSVWSSGESGFESQGSVSGISSHESGGSGSGGSGTARGGFMASVKHVVVFQLAGTRYALETTHVGEVISLEKSTAVPLTASCILGVRNLRGTALPIVDLAAVLELTSERTEWDLEEGVTALVLTLPGDINAAIPIDRVEAVVPWQDSDLRASEVIGEHAAVRGILDLARVQGQTTTLLDSQELTRRLEALRPEAAVGAFDE